MEITVVGSARATRPPERATIALNVALEGNDKRHVLEGTTALVKSLSAEVDRLRQGDPAPVTKAAVRPIGTRSWRPWSDQGRILPLRHAASCALDLTFRDFGALSAFVDAWGAVDGISLGGVEWTLTEAVRAELETTVLGEAVARARERAQILATAGGGGPVRCLEIADPGLLTEQRSAESAPIAMFARSAADVGGGEGIDIVPHDVDIEAQVHVRCVSDPAG